MSCGLTLLAILWQKCNDEDDDNDGFQVPTSCTYIASIPKIVLSIQLMAITATAGI